MNPAKKKSMTSAVTSGIRMKPMQNATDPKSIRATEIPRNSDPKAAGDVGFDEEDAAFVSTGNGRGRGGVRRR